MDATIPFTVNGRRSEVTTDPDRPLLDVLREELKLTGTKYGCGEARCGACTVLIDGKRTFSCVTPIARAQGKTIQTIEGLSPPPAPLGGDADDAKRDEPKLHPGTRRSWPRAPSSAGTARRG